jgi:hypothetical protein
MLYVIIGLIILTLISVIHYQAKVKEHERKLYGQSSGSKGGPSGEDVLMLDDEEAKDRNFAQPPPKTFITLSIGLTVIAVFYYVFFSGPTEAAGDITYEQLAAKALGQTIMADARFAKSRSVPILVVLPPRLYNEYNTKMASAKQEERKFPIVDALREEVSKGNKMIIKAVVPSISMLTPNALTRADVDLTSNGLRELTLEHADAQIVVAFTGYRPDLTRKVDRNVYLACYVDRALLYDYLELATAKAFDLAVLTRGLYNPNTALPLKANLDEMVKRSFVLITPANAAQLSDPKGGLRQYIGVFPIEKNGFCK